MSKRGYTLIAEHLGTDAESVRDYEYQHGRFVRPIFALSDNEYWAAGQSKPCDPDGILNSWEKVVSSYDRKSILWVCRQPDE